MQAYLETPVFLKEEWEAEISFIKFLHCESSSQFLYMKLRPQLVLGPGLKVFFLTKVCSWSWIE